MVADEGARRNRPRIGMKQDTPLAILLKNNGALSVSAIARFLETGGEQIYADLQELVEAGLVEAIQPISGDPANRFDLEYYRWVQRSDMDYAWQTELLRRTYEQGPRIERRIALLLATG